MNVNEAYKLAKPYQNNLPLISIIETKNEFGFAFHKGSIGSGIIDGIYTMVSKTNKNVENIPVIPDTLSRFTNAKQLPITEFDKN